MTLKENITDIFLGDPGMFCTWDNLSFSKDLYELFTKISGNYQRIPNIFQRNLENFLVDPDIFIKYPGISILIFKFIGFIKRISKYWDKGLIICTSYPDHLWCAAGKN